MARPTKYNEKLADTITERLALGESMRAISRDPKMPSMSTLFKWLREIPEFSQQYARAKEESAEGFADAIIDIAEHEEDVQRAKLMIDARKWIASKLKPKKYGDRVTNEITGEGGGPLSINVRFVDSDS